MIEQNIALLESGELLTKNESVIFDKIRSAGDHFGNKVVCRVAGGWVRDKLLNKECDDIDICVEGCTSEEFALQLAEQYPKKATKIVVFEENPKQAKFMKTVRVCIYGSAWIDICNLRGENLVATALTDAQHRDLSINALFYNITDSKVEDFVGGIQDLKNQVIRTPISPDVTFTEDPLRIIRSIRFHVRYGYKIDENLLEIAKLHLSDFEQRVSKERIASEIIKIIRMDGFIEFVDLIIKIGFFETIFDPFHRYSIDPLQARERLSIVTQRSPKEFVIPIQLGAILFPIYNEEPVPDPEHPKTKIPPIECTICRYLKFPTKYAHEANILVKGALRANTIKLDRRIVGHWIREIGPIWPFIKFLIFDQAEYEKCENVLYNFIREQGLATCYDMKCLINGKDLANLLGVKLGKGFQTHVDDLIDWQLGNPNGTREDYIEFIKNKKFNCLFE